MKSLALAAVLAASAAGSAFAKGDGGCIFKPGNPRPKAAAQAQNDRPVRYCGDEPCRPKPIIRDPQAAAPAAAQELPKCDMLPNCKR